MIDIHNHILPNIDDGSKSFEESINILKQAYESGVTDIIVTPHFILGSSYSSKVKDNETILKELKNKLKLENININLYLGNEIFVENNMLELLKNKSVTSLNKSRYVLFELPMNNNFKGLKDLLFNLQVNGYIPVIAHPERYRFIKENPEAIMELHQAGALFQVNVGSILGNYGDEARKTVMLLLKHQIPSFIATDTHHDTHEFYKKIIEVKNILKKYIPEDYIEELFNVNNKNILENKIFEPRETIPFKKGLFGKIK